MIEVWYIRHGESEANAGLATENQQAILLTETGHDQACKTSLVFERTPTLIVTSKYTRAIQTAQYTVDRFPKVPVETWGVHEFTYLSPVILGKTTMKERWPIVQAYWDRCDPAYIHGEGAESFEDFVSRVKKLDKLIRSVDNGFIVIFGHGFVMKMTIWANLLGSFDTIADTMGNFYAFQKSFAIPNCAIFKAEYHPGKTLFSGLSTDHLR